jgi:uncharacterized membrane protein YGL010W
MNPATANPKLDALINHYASSHRNRRNEIIHCVCVPAILFAVVGLLLGLNFGVTLLAVAAAILYYNRLSQVAALQMGVLLLFMLAVWMMVMPAHHIVALALSIYVLGWIGQFIGHRYEGAKPAFLEDLQYLLIGPLFVLSVLRKKLFLNPRLDPQ